MSSVYRRPDSPYWWCWFLDVNGKRKPASLKTTDERTARRRLEKIEAQVAAQREAGAVDGPLTLRRYGDRWLDKRKESDDFNVVENRSMWKTWVIDQPIASLPLVDVRHSHLVEYMKWLAKQVSKKTERPLAPRTRLKIYALLRVMFSDAVADEGIDLDRTPCTLEERRKELPSNADADPRWRQRAVFSSEEVALLLSSPVVPLWRRVTYGVLFLTGLRISEASVRRISDYDAKAKPLGRLVAPTTWSTEKKREKEPKTGVPREIPVIPPLAKLLKQWLEHGWEEMLGRAPAEDDLLLPNSVGTRQHRQDALQALHRDLDALGLRRRRIHDTRRTFISLALAAGATERAVKYCTHTTKSQAFDQYNTPPWPFLCRELAKLEVSAPESRRRRGVTPELRSETDDQNTNEHDGLH